MMSIKKMSLTIVAIAVCLLAVCGGGFGADNDEARDLGPGVFGTDSSRK